AGAITGETAPSASALPTPASGNALPPGPDAAKRPAAQEPQQGQDLQKLVAEWDRLVRQIQTRERRVLAEAAQMSVELGTAIAERLIGSEIAANRQRLDRIVLGALERMQAARSIVMRGHPDDLALLTRQLAEHVDAARYGA